MEVILLKDKDKLGQRNDLVKVKDGYARNYLIPQGIAVTATDAQKKMRNETLRQQAHKEEKLKEQAQQWAQELKDSVVKIPTKVGEQGKIFGSVNNIQVADELKKLGYKVDRKNIKLNQEEPIKHVGQYEAEVEFHKDVKQTITIEVVEEEGAKKK